MEGRKINERSVPAALSGAERRQFFRVECEMKTEFRLTGGHFWVPADVLDLSVAGMKIRFDPFFRGKTIRPEALDWAGSDFRFPAKGGFFKIEGYFLRVYLREPGKFTAGVEFDEPTPEQQFKLVELYGAFRRRRQGV